MLRFFILSCLMIFLARPAFADDLADGIAAYKQKDYPKALMLLRPLADGGNVVAERQVGLMYFWGQGIKKDDQTAMKYFQAAADKGAIADQLTLAMFYQHDGDNARDLKMEGSFGSATKDYAEARKWFDKAFAQGSVEAVRRIGNMYREERGVEQDYRQAAAWYAKAAAAGDAPAQYELGLLYKKGLGVQTNMVQAYMWLSLAAARGEKEAGEQRDFLAKTMLPDEVKQATQMTASWKQSPLDMSPPAPPAPKAAPAPVAPDAGAPAAASPAPAAAKPAEAAPAAEQPRSDDPNSAPAP